MKGHDGRSSSLHLTRLISSPITRPRCSGICSQNCVVSFDRSLVMRSSPFFFRQQGDFICSPQRQAQTLQAGSKMPASVPWIQLRRSVSTTLRTLRQQMLSLWIEWCKWIGYLILVARCMSSSVIPLASGSLSTSSRFGSRWDAMNDRNETVLMDFAKGKLLDGPTTLLEKDRSGSLACLSVRFALEFNMEGTAGDIVCTQVERHMRLCLAATAGPEKFITLAGSEPILAEAAHELMKRSQSIPVHRSAHRSDLNCVDRVRRGEPLQLFSSCACDAARVVSSRSRWVPVDDFMKELLPPPEYDVFHKSRPTIWHNGERERTFVEPGLRHLVFTTLSESCSRPTTSRKLIRAGRRCCVQPRTH